MSDGPHRSLKMRRGWKQLAERADNRAYAPEEIRDAVIPVLARDWRADVPDALAGRVCEILSGLQDTLFREQKIAQLEALQPMAAGHGLGGLFIDYAIQAVSEGRSDGDVAVETGAAALRSWAARGARQVEEHYCRKSTLRRGNNVRLRIEEGIGSASLKDLVRQLLKLGPQSAPRTPPRQTGLDDGVRI